MMVCIKSELGYFQQLNTFTYYNHSDMFVKDKKRATKYDRDLDKKKIMIAMRTVLMHSAIPELEEV